MIAFERVGERLQAAVHTELTIYQVAELHSAASPWLAQPCDWALDLDEVPEIDGAGLQWLLHLYHQLRASGHALSVTQASACVAEAMRLCPTALASPACP
ncbi:MULTISPECIES: lipid asymmetry maintenance protein MlaB [unclassified Pseudomonas]|uniref:STAS domain-containing protein n=1 Tax=unclassified Pseudomonas TaxID=196821 RepID=UPI000BC547F5|nr:MULTISPECIES: STAS domain-containing protein [unclassified Pseudomonas]PVZ12500.1 anti-anti-sigma factor [Pseudomonas sp. URIL14HWK12:I12]PVZ23348.1 anti-anti-sigma factor [Pseudomonas sp. URIL14HWK12:I10]PVZ32678.1 anti-anti-sigma factor [Pseudomonas sp. URIL14HWK12:I11]SNZ13832.1 anti-anti-sigma factor [Pseudomonas sp. URIL14HWK12:I9]